MANPYRGSSPEAVAYSTAFHEASHAVAYISLRLRFAYISVDDALTAPAGELINTWQRAVMYMAGPASEGVMYHWETGTDADVLDYILSGRADALEYAEELPSDYSEAGPLAMLALPQALALITSNWSVIEQIAEAALRSPAALTYERVMAIVADGVRMDPAEYHRWHTACSALPLAGK